MRLLSGLKLKIVFYIILGTLVSSCTVKMIYHQLDYLIPQYVEDMVTLDDMLEDKVEARTQALLKWHRNTQLKQYAVWFRELQKDINNQLTEATLKRHLVTLEAFFYSITSSLNNEMADLLPLLNEAQRKELFENIAEKNKEFWEDYIEVDRKERVEDYKESTLDNFENWFGDLTDSQLSAIERAANDIEATAGYRYQRRLKWQESIKNILDENASAGQTADKLRVFFKQYQDNKSKEMKDIERKNKAIFTRLTLYIVRSMNREQKTHFMTVTNDYIRMFEELANEL